MIQRAMKRKSRFCSIFGSAGGGLNCLFCAGETGGGAPGNGIEEISAHLKEGRADG